MGGDLVVETQGVCFWVTFFLQVQNGSNDTCPQNSQSFPGGGQVAGRDVDLQLWGSPGLLGPKTASGGLRELEEVVSH